MNARLDKTKLVRYGFLLAAAILWGFSFVAQAVDEIAPFTFTATRSLIGAAVLVPVFLTMDAIRKRRGDVPTLSLEERKKARLLLLVGGVVCGVVICVATNLQQYGLSMNLEAGKAGFITAMYIVLVPVIGLFRGKKLLPEGLKGKSKAAAEQNQEQHHRPLLAALREAEASGDDRRRKAQNAHRPKLDHPDRQRIRVFTDLFRHHDADGIGHGCQNHQDNTQSSVRTAVLGEGKKSDAHDCKRGAEQGLFLRGIL